MAGILFSVIMLIWRLWTRRCRFSSVSAAVYSPVSGPALVSANLDLLLKVQTVDARSASSAIFVLESEIGGGGLT